MSNYQLYLLLWAGFILGGDNPALTRAEEVGYNLIAVVFGLLAGATLFLTKDKP